MEEFRWFECNEEETEGLLDVTLSNKTKEYFEENRIEGEVEWLVYYTRFLCEDTESNRQYLEDLEVIEIEEEEEEW